MIQKLEIDRVVIDGDTRPHGGGQGYFPHINTLRGSGLGLFEVREHRNQVALNCVGLKAEWLQQSRLPSLYLLAPGPDISKNCLLLDSFFGTLTNS